MCTESVAKCNIGAEIVYRKRCKKCNIGAEIVYGKRWQNVK